MALEVAADLLFEFLQRARLDVELPLEVGAHLSLILEVSHAAQGCSVFLSTSGWLASAQVAHFGLVQPQSTLIHHQGKLVVWLKIHASQAAFTFLHYSTTITHPPT